MIGKFHPHGDAAVYDAMVRLAQTFATRYPLIEGQGNFGSIDGDAQAAMRYTEARLTEYCMLMFYGIDEDTVEFIPNYDGLELEPQVLPAAVPNIILNGSEGIAVGMATNIPPHNILEVLDCTIAVLKEPNLSDEQLISIILAPDFPTGGVIVTPKEAIAELYRSGHGSITLRAKWHHENTKNGYDIVITEIPYKVNKSSIIEQLAKIYEEKAIDGLTNIRDLSDEQIKIVINISSSVIRPEYIMAKLFYMTQLETKIGVNMNMLNLDDLPEVMTLRRIIDSFIANRKAMEVKYINHHLKKIAERIEVLLGYIIIYDNITEVTNIIRNEDYPEKKMKELWNLSNLQIDAILNMKLRALKRLDESMIREERQNLLQKQCELGNILATEGSFTKHIVDFLAKLRAKLAKNEHNQRKTSIADMPIVDLSNTNEQQVPQPGEQVEVLYSVRGWIKCITPDTQSIYKHGDRHGLTILSDTNASLLCFSSAGKVYTLNVDSIPRSKGYGEPLKLMLNIPDSEEIVYIMPFCTAQKILLLSDNGRGFVAYSQDMLSRNKSNKQIMRMQKNSTLCFVKELNTDSIALLGDNRCMLILDTKDIGLASKCSSGYQLQKYKVGGLRSAILFNEKDGITWQAGDKMHHIDDFRLWKGKPGDRGRIIFDKVWIH